MPQRYNEQFMTNDIILLAFHQARLANIGVLRLCSTDWKSFLMGDHVNFFITAQMTPLLEVKIACYA